MPCYVFDGEFKKHDLNPLIKISGGYLVDDSDPDTSLFINVCRDIGRFGGVVVKDFSEGLGIFALLPFFLVGISVSLSRPPEEPTGKMLCITSPPGSHSVLIPLQILSRLLVHPSVFSLTDVLVPGFSHS